jgi:enterochelin esterase-like enzyme
MAINEKKGTAMRNIMPACLGRRRLLCALAGILGLVAAAAAAASPASAHAHTVVSPQVIHTRTAPTGYEVTFRYYDPAATSVQVRGEWYFSNAASTTTTTSAGLLPSQWAPGDFPIAYPNQGPAPNWPVAQMKLNPATGVWSYTTPLPSGTFTYGFYVDCTSPPPGLAGCTELADPSNPPWNTIGSVEPDSQVYVPSDARFGTPDMSWQAPKRAHGTLVDVSYPDPQSTNPAGSHPLAVYLPPGYNPHRRIPYPTLYLSHGGGGNEVDWSTQGAANRIIGNLIAARKAQPMVIVMTNFNNLGTCALFDGSCYANDLANYVIPYVDAHYNVSRNASDRAFAGLSLGGLRANYLLFNNTTLFGYFGSWSIGSLGAPAATSPLWQNPALKSRLGIQIGGGNFDSLTVPGINTYEATLATNGIPFTDARLDAGHEWYTWRQLLYDYATTVAFRHTTTSVSPGTSSRPSDNDGLTAAVTADTAEPAAPTGRVQFYLDGHQTGAPRSVGRDGTATLPLEHGLSAGTHTITAVYSGDSFYNTSTSSAFSFSAG